MRVQDNMKEAGFELDSLRKEGKIDRTDLFLESDSFSVSVSQMEFFCIEF